MKELEAVDGHEVMIEGKNIEQFAYHAN